MGGVRFEVHQVGADLETAFQSARQAAAREHGWQEDSGTIATKDRVMAVQTFPLDVARCLADLLLDQLDEPYCDHYDRFAAAIPIADFVNGPCTGWLFIGFANE